MQQTHYVSFRKVPRKRLAIRVTFAVPADSKQEAKTIAEKELQQPKGYRYQGVD